MKVPLSWLKEYVDIGLSAEEVAHLLTMAGTEVAGIETIGDWGPCGGCNTDIDGSGTVDVSDLLTVIGDWGPCE